jgi:hypothetical protein
MAADLATGKAATAAGRGQGVMATLGAMPKL